mmetsp:Transcript_30014/g.75526  ORF Transcript_30014/g.75526 Transcript_30014/m.75526 type:complete len:321 (-) Transcript_30014:87-1049(-)
MRAVVQLCPQQRVAEQLHPERHRLRGQRVHGGVPGELGLRVQHGGRPLAVRDQAGQLQHLQRGAALLVQPVAVAAARHVGERQAELAQLGAHARPVRLSTVVPHHHIGARRGQQAQELQRHPQLARQALLAAAARHVHVVVAHQLHAHVGRGGAVQPLARGRRRAVHRRAGQVPARHAHRLPPHRHAQCALGVLRQPQHARQCAVGGRHKRVQPRLVEERAALPHVLLARVAAHGLRERHARRARLEKVGAQEAHHGAGAPLGDHANKVLQGLQNGGNLGLRGVGWDGDISADDLATKLGLALELLARLCEHATDTKEQH